MANQNLNVTLVVFKPDHAPVVAGVTCTKVEAGWKGAELTLKNDCVLISVPNQRKVLVHRSNTRQVDLNA